MEHGDPRYGIFVWIDQDKDRIDETLELCEAAGYSIIDELSQARSEPDPRFYIGSGKIDEISDLESAESADYLIIPSDLTPDQTFHMRRATGKIVIDRIRLILEIFRMRANTPESRLQVELADLRHQLPIVREYVHKGKLSERPGFMAGGEYRVDYYYDMIRRRMSAISTELRQIRTRRSRTRRRRSRHGVHQISIAGYTNAGKSTLLNSLIEDGNADKETEVGARVFTTLSTSTRRMNGGRNCLITDTVGFIRDLPPWLVEGFMSTLEEVFESEIILLVVDLSDREGEISRKLADSLEILANGDAAGGIIIVGNKLDLCGGREVNEIEKELYSMIRGSASGLIRGISLVSADTGEGIDELIGSIHGLLPVMMKMDFELPHSPGGEAALSGMRKRWSTVDVEYRSAGISGSVEIEERWIGTLRKLIETGGGRLIRETDSSK
ncbi:MAG: GTPase HflX [Thermoplasmatota archaeon]